jgi:hypothetical protein
MIFSEQLIAGSRRLSAFRTEALRGWPPEAGSSRESTHPNVIEAAAAEPLILEDTRFPRAIFDPESFRRRLLEIAAKRKKA